ncbi:MAG: metallophosphoesterase family protein [Planctomycetes bacterium]|nr:metallophosphoesterase family protein [Planctomycetota bacterium]
MKVCVFSDIHGNGPAFSKAFGSILSERADLNIFLGDLCGYYYDQMEILHRLKTIPNLLAILGNHDSTFLKILDGNEGLRQTHMEKYGNSMENLLSCDTSDLTKWLRLLPKLHVNADQEWAIYHGSPWDALEGYVYPDTPLDEFQEYSSSFFFLGHTHYPMTREIGNKLIINPGSLGQPRTGGWPTYAMVDLQRKEVAFREVIYDKEQVLYQIDKIDADNKYLKEVILRQTNHG